MKTLKFLATATLALVSMLCEARTVTDTLFSAKGDRLILSYDISQSERQFTIRFNRVQKRLGATHREKYDKLSEVIPMFFDRTGRYESTKFGGLTPTAFIVPANLSYEKSEDGFFNMQENPTVMFSLKSGNASKISIPIYLTHYEKKGRYNVFSKCGDLRIQLNKGKSSTHMASTEIVSQTVTSTSEIEADNDDITEALGTVERVMGLLAMADRLPFSENLTFEVTQLRMMRSKMQDAATLQRINDALDAYDAKKQELESNAEASAMEAQAKAEQEAQKVQREQQAKADSIAAETQKQAEKSQKRTIWMIIGGAILAVACFVGNQAFQHFRNLSNQRSMQEMQDRMVKQAESEAKRRAQSYAHNKIHQAKNMARNSARDALKGIKTNNKGSKNNGPKTI